MKAANKVMRKMQQEKEKQLKNADRNTLFNKDNVSKNDGQHNTGYGFDKGELTKGPKKDKQAKKLELQKKFYNNKR